MSVANTSPNTVLKLAHDLSTLVNNPFASDVCFLVGGGDTEADSTNEDPTISTFHAHSLILRLRSKYFATMLKENAEWKKTSKCKIRQPNVSAVIFGIVLKYLYTGDIEISDPFLLP